MPTAKRPVAAKAAPRRGRPPGTTREATRQRIVAAACECFGARGYELTTNQDVGARAKVTAPAIYRYFDSKLLLYMEAFRAAHAEVLPLLRRAVAEAEHARDALAALTRAYAVAWERFPAATAFLSGIPVEVRQHPEIASAAAAEPDTALQVIAGIVDRGVASGVLAREDSSAAVSMFLAMTLGLSQLAAIAGKSALDDAIGGYTKLLEERLFVDAPRQKTRASR